MIATLITIFYGAAFGWSEGSKDAQDINDGIEIRHRRAFAFRVLLTAMMMAAMCWVFGYGFLRWAGLCLLAGAAFNPLFRYSLNRDRVPSKPWDYVSASNRYDTFLIARFGAKAGKMAYVLETALAVLLVFVLS